MGSKRWGVWIDLVRCQEASLPLPSAPQSSIVITKIPANVAKCLLGTNLALTKSHCSRFVLCRWARAKLGMDRENKHACQGDGSRPGCTPAIPGASLKYRSLGSTLRSDVVDCVGLAQSSPDGCDATIVESHWGQIPGDWSPHSWWPELSCIPRVLQTWGALTTKALLRAQRGC